MDHHRIGATDMRMLYDVTALQTPSSQVRGIGSYVWNLYTRLVSTQGVDILSMGFDRPVPDVGARPEVDIGPGPRSSLEFTALSLALRRSRPWPRDAGLHFTSLSAVGAERGLRRRYVATVFDLIPLMWPDDYMGGWLSQRHYRAYLEHLRGAARLVAISESVADDVADRLDYPRDRVSVTPLGVPPLPAPEPEPLEEEPYVFLAGTPDPHKNARFVIRAVSTMPVSVRPNVVMTGAGADRVSALGLWARTLGVTVEHLGRVSRGELSTLYRHSAVVLVPSLYEGFGLQALEALSVGANVAVSQAGALPDVVGDAALVLPFDIGLWADTMTCALFGAWPIDSERGPERAAAFTWERTAKSTLAAYRLVWR